MLLYTFSFSALKFIEFLHETRFISWSIVLGEGHLVVKTLLVPVRRTYFHHRRKYFTKIFLAGTQIVFD